MTLPDFIPADVAGWSDAEYRAADGVNFSILKHMDASPLHYRHAADSDEDTSTYSRDRLRAAHCLALEPHNFDRDFAVYDGPGTRATKAYKAWAEENDGRTLLTAADFEQASDVAAAVRAHPVAGAVLRGRGWAEMPMRWHDGPSGLTCKGKVDFYTGYSPEQAVQAVWDLKQIDSTHPRRVAYHVARNLWHVQAAHYTEGVRALTGLACDFFLIVVEAKQPHDVCVYHIHPESGLDIGQAKRHELLDKVVACNESGVWAGRSNYIEELILPSWLDDNDDDILIMDGE